MRMFFYTVLAGLVAGGAYLYAEEQASPGRCQPLPDGMTIVQYQAKLANENPGWGVWIQRIQSSRFIWERDTGIVQCGEGQYAAVFFELKK